MKALHFSVFCFAKVSLRTPLGILSDSSFFLRMNSCQSFESKHKREGAIKILVFVELLNCKYCIEPN